MDRKTSIKYNSSGYYDPTPYEAIKKVRTERDELASKLVSMLQNMTHLVGFEIVGRIALRDKETGEVYK